MGGNDGCGSGVTPAFCGKSKVHHSPKAPRFAVQEGTNTRTLKALGQAGGSGLVLSLNEKTRVNSPWKEQVLCRMEVVSVEGVNQGVHCTYLDDAGPGEAMATRD